MLTTLFYSLLALDQTLATLAAQYGPWLYALLFAVIFAETGLVVFPFLPGDSLLFIAGTVVAARRPQRPRARRAADRRGDPRRLASTTRSATTSARKVFDRPDSRWFKQEHLRRTQAFYDRYGGGHDHHRPLRADHPHVRAVPRRRGGHALPALPRVQRGRRRSLWIALARLRRLPVRQHPVGQGQPVAASSSAIVVVSLIPAVTTFLQEHRRSAAESARRSRPPRQTRACASSAARPT